MGSQQLSLAECVWPATIQYVLGQILRLDRDQRALLAVRICNGQRFSG